MRKPMKPLIIFLILFIELSLLACYKTDAYRFVSGEYEYTGDSVEFYDSLSIEFVKVTLVQITEDEYLDRDSVNVIQNGYNDEYFGLTLEIRFANETNSSSYPVEFVGKIGNRSDSYEFILTLENESIDIEANLHLIIEFLGDFGTDSDNTAKRLYLLKFGSGDEINGVSVSSDDYSLPTNLYYVEENKK